MKLSIVFALIVAAPFVMNTAIAGGCANNTNGQVVCAPGGVAAVNSYGRGCATNSHGEVVCAPPGGGAEVDVTGEVITGRGGCARNIYGQAVCAGGCVVGQ